MAYHIDWFTETIIINNFEETLKKSLHILNSYTNVIISNECNLEEEDFKNLKHIKSLKFDVTNNYFNNINISRLDVLTDLTNLEVLVFPSNFRLCNNDIINLNKMINLKVLDMGNCYNLYNPINIRQLINLEELYLSGSHQLDLTYFNKLKKLVLGNAFNETLENKLPESLETLILGSEFNQSLENLPNNIIFLAIKSNKYDFNLNMLPDNIKKLFLPKIIKCKLEKLPNNLEQIYVTPDNYDDIKQLIGDKNINIKKYFIDS